MSITDFLGRWASIRAEYNSLLPPGQTLKDDLAQRDRFSMVCILATLGPDHAPVRDQILTSPTIPSMDEVFSRLLRVSSIPNAPLGSFPSVDNSVLASQVTSRARLNLREEPGRDRGGNRGDRP